MQVYMITLHVRLTAVYLCFLAFIGVLWEYSTYRRDHGHGPPTTSNWPMHGVLAGGGEQEEKSDDMNA